MVQVVLRRKMLQIFNQNYGKILKKIPQKLIGDFLKTSINFLLFGYWVIIAIGTFLMLN